jgi:hypothetical protein
VDVFLEVSLRNGSPKATVLSGENLIKSEGGPMVQKRGREVVMKTRLAFLLMRP